MSIVTVRWFVTVAIKFGISGGLLLLVFSFAPLGGVVDAIGAANLQLVLLGTVALLLRQYISAWKLYYLISPQGILASIARLFSINLASHFYGCVLPMGAATSAIARWYKLSVINGQRFQAFAAVILNRVLDFLMISGIGVCAWVLDAHPGRLAFAGSFMSLAFGFSVLAYALVISSRVLTCFQKVTDRANRVFPPIAVGARKITSALACYPRLSIAQHCRLLLLSLVRNLVGVLAFYLLCAAVGIEVSLVTVAWVRSAIAVLAFVPLSIFGLGIREATLLFLLHPYLVPESSAVALGFLYLAANLGVAAIGGILELPALISRWLFSLQRSPTQ